MGYFPEFSRQEFFSNWSDLRDNRPLCLITEADLFLKYDRAENLPMFRFDCSCRYRPNVFSPLESNILFLYPLKIPIPFSEGIEMKHWTKMG